MHQPRSLKSKLKTLEELRDIIAGMKREGKRIVFTNGCFDILHAGHVCLLEEARRQGDALVVAMNSDRSVAGLKGAGRPVVPEHLRAQVLGALESVDYVVIFDEPDPLCQISTVVPDILVKGGDWKPEQIVGRDVVERAGGRVVTIPLKYGASTTDIISTVIKKHSYRYDSGP